MRPRPGDRGGGIDVTGENGRVVEIFTDGACSPNPGPGGWGAILRYGQQERERHGGGPATTNNRMEIMAAIPAPGRHRVGVAVEGDRLADPPQDAGQERGPVGAPRPGGPPPRGAVVLGQG